MVGENLTTYDETEHISPRQREESFLKTLKMVLLEIPMFLSTGPKSYGQKLEHTR